MPTIVKIGYHTYLMKNDSAAAAVCKAMIGAVRLDDKSVKVGQLHKTIYWPDTEHQTEVGIEMIGKDQLFPREPSEPEVTAFAERRQLGGAKPPKQIGL